MQYADTEGNIIAPALPRKHVLPNNPGWAFLITARVRSINMSFAAAPHLEFRSFVEALKKEHDIVSITREVDPNLEAAAITRLVHENDLPAPLFENVKGSKDGLFRILGAPAALRNDKKTRFGRLARHIGLEPTASIKQILDKIISADKLEPIEPTVLENGPCKQNIIHEKDVHLNALPLAWAHKDDGGKYIQTYGTSCAINARSIGNYKITYNDRRQACCAVSSR